MLMLWLRAINSLLKVKQNIFFVAEENDEKISRFVTDLRLTDTFIEEALLILLSDI